MHIYWNEMTLWASFSIFYLGPRIPVCFSSSLSSIPPTPDEALSLFFLWKCGKPRILPSHASSLPHWEGQDHFPGHWVELALYLLPHLLHFVVVPKMLEKWWSGGGSLCHPSFILSLVIGFQTCTFLFFWQWTPFSKWDLEVAQFVKECCSGWGVWGGERDMNPCHLTPTHFRSSLRVPACPAWREHKIGRQDPKW